MSAHLLIEAASHDAVPAVIGTCFAPGEMTDSTLVASGGQSVIPETWWYTDDGTPNGIKTCFVAGFFAPGEQVTLEGAATAAGALDLDAIAKAAPSAAVHIDGETISLHNLLDEGTIWRRSAQHIEARYAASSSVGLDVVFDVRLFGKYQPAVEVSISLEHGSVQWTAHTQRIVANVAVEIDGHQIDYREQQVIQRSTAPLQYRRWIGQDQYRVSVRWDHQRWVRAGIVPDYGMASGADEDTLDGLPSEYVIGEKLWWSKDWSGTGDAAQLGLMPQWAALWAVSGDPRAAQSMQAHDDAALQWPIVRRSAPGVPFTISDEPTAVFNGDGTGGTYLLSAGEFQIDSGAHAPLIGASYLLTGRQQTADALAMHLMTSWLMLNRRSYGDGVDRHYLGQRRGWAWIIRSLSFFTAIMPARHRCASDIAALLRSNIERQCLASTVDGEEFAGELGITYAHGDAGDYDHARAGQSTVVWEHDFCLAALGYASDLLPHAHRLRALRDYSYRFLDLMHGELGRCATAKYVVIGPESSVYYSTGPASYREAKSLYQTTMAAANATRNAYPKDFAHCDSDPIQQANSPYHPVNSVALSLANRLPALAYAVKHQHPRAAEYWRHLTSASNWATFAALPWNKNPKYGVVPRNIEAEQQEPEQPQEPPPMSDPFADMPLNTWVADQRVTPQQIRDLLERENDWFDWDAHVFGVERSPKALMRGGAYSGCVVDEERREIILKNPGGHGTTSFDAVVALSIDSGEWRQILAPSNPDDPAAPWSEAYRTSKQYTYPAPRHHPDFRTMAANGRNQTSSHQYRGMAIGGVRVADDEARRVVLSTRHGFHGVDLETGETYWRKFQYRETGRIIEPSIYGHIYESPCEPGLFLAQLAEKYDGNRWCLLRLDDADDQCIYVDAAPQPGGHKSSLQTCAIGEKVFCFGSEKYREFVSIWDWADKAWTDHMLPTNNPVTYDIGGNTVSDPYAMDGAACVAIPEWGENGQILRRFLNGDVVRDWVLYDIATNANYRYAPDGDVPPANSRPYNRLGRIGGMIFYLDATDDAAPCLRWLKPAPRDVELVPWGYVPPEQEEEPPVVEPEPEPQPEPEPEPEPDPPQRITLRAEITFDLDDLIKAIEGK